MRLTIELEPAHADGAVAARSDGSLTSVDGTIQDMLSGRVQRARIKEPPGEGAELSDRAFMGF